MERIRKVILENDYFRLFELADGVYAAIEKGNNTGSNAGVIDLGSGTVIFDTFLNIDAARELKKASEKLTGNSVQYVINSHGHTDHILGNYLFPAATAIISSEPVRESIAKASTEFEKEKDLYPPRVKEIEDILSSGDSVENKTDLLNELQFLSSLVKPGVEIRIPNLTFAKDMVLHGSKRSLHLRTFDVAHTPGDSIAYLPDENICFMGDLLCNKMHSWLGTGSPEQFIKVAGEILDYDIYDFVPGHGPLSTKADVLNQIKYINEVINLVKKKGSGDVKDYSVKELSPVFWDWNSLCFSWNINFLIKRMQKSDIEI